MILETLTLGPFEVNCYIVGSETAKEGIIIDPGDEPDAILESLEKLGLAIKLIVLTHAHPDHIGGVKAVKEATKAPLALHEEEWKMLSSGYRAFSSWVPVEALPEPERFLGGGDFIEVGEFRFTVLHTPGHSPGGICLYGAGVVFTGDTLFNLGVGRTDFMGSMAQLLNSINTKLLVLPPFTRVFPGHGPATTIGMEAQWNPFLR